MERKPPPFTPTEIAYVHDLVVDFWSSFLGNKPQIDPDQHCFASTLPDPTMAYGLLSSSRRMNAGSLRPDQTIVFRHHLRKGLKSGNGGLCQTAHNYSAASRVLATASKAAGIAGLRLFPKSPTCTIFDEAGLTIKCGGKHHLILFPDEIRAKADGHVSNAAGDNAAYTHLMDETHVLRNGSRVEKTRTEKVLSILGLIAGGNIEDNSFTPENRPGQSFTPLDLLHDIVAMAKKETLILANRSIPMMQKLGLLSDTAEGHMMSWQDQQIIDNASALDGRKVVLRSPLKSPLSAALHTFGRRLSGLVAS